MEENIWDSWDLQDCNDSNNPRTGNKYSFINDEGGHGYYIYAENVASAREKFEQKCQDEGENSNDFFLEQVENLPSEEIIWHYFTDAGLSVP